MSEKNLNTLKKILMILQYCGVLAALVAFVGFGNTVSKVASGIVLAIWIAVIIIRKVIEK